jgi:FkbM family methyltransferase
MKIFDIGANIGKFAIANVTDDTEIISVEASPTTYLKLVENVKNYNNVKPINYAVTFEEKETIIFYECTAADTVSTLNKDWLTSEDSRFGYFKNNVREINVPTISLDKMINIYGMPDIIKIDVECAEDQVIKSLSYKVDTICFEWASEFKEMVIECLLLLENLGFTKFHVQMEDNYVYRPEDYNSTMEDILQFLDKTTPKKEWGMIWAK